MILILYGNIRESVKESLLFLERFSRRKDLAVVESKFLFVGYIGQKRGVRKMDGKIKRRLKGWYNFYYSHLVVGAYAGSMNFNFSEGVE